MMTLRVFVAYYCHCAVIFSQLIHVTHLLTSISIRIFFIVFPLAESNGREILQLLQSATATSSRQGKSVNKTVTQSVGQLS